MGILSIIGLALALAMDAFAVSVISGAVYKNLKVKHIFLMAFFFGGFQFFMPIIGFLAGLSLINYLSGYDHWVAFGLLVFIGGKMIFESFEIKHADDRKSDPSNLAVLFVLALATSIDALAVGITLSILNIGIIKPVVIIGLITFLLSYCGVYIGKKFGHFFESKIEAVGGLVLIVLGFKILFEHLFAK